MSKDVYEHENEKKSAGSVDTGKIFALMMMIAFITFKSSLVPLFEGLRSSNS